jgi:hypothetical protein
VVAGEEILLSKTNKKLGLFISIAAIALLVPLVSFLGAYASSGYSVTSNYHGIDTPLGATVTVTATTTDTKITQVMFIWRNAEKIEQWRETVPVTGGEAQSSGQPNSLGDWGVQALFQGPDGKTKEGIEEVVSIKATSFFVVPEYAVGGLLAIGACFGAFALFKKRPRIHI